MAQDACNADMASPVNSNIDKPACSCSQINVKNDSEKRPVLTCSCEDCTEAKTCLYYIKRSGGLSDKKSDACCAQSNLPGHPPKITEVLGICQLYNKFKSTAWPITPSAASETKPKKESVKCEKCSCIGDQTYAIMTATLHKQESIVGIQKKAYLPEKYLSESKPKKCILEKCSCVGDQTYGIMTATLRKQESIVGIQKRAYLPEKYLSESKPIKECMLEKCSCFADQIYGAMTATLHKQKSIVGIQKRAYLPEKDLSESKPKKESALEECMCMMMHSDSCSIVQNKVKKESTNRCGAIFDSEVPKIYHVQELPDYLNSEVQKSSDVPNICCHKQETSEVPKSFHKRESSDLMKDAAGYVFDIPKICFHMQQTSEVPKSFHKRESSDLMKGAAGYVFDIPKICCHKQETSEVPKKECALEECMCIMHSDSCCLVQNKYKKESTNRCCATFDSEVPKIYHVQELPDYFNSEVQKSSEVPNICCHKQVTSEVPKSFHKRESSDLMKGAAGYVFDIPKICFHKQETSEVPKNFHKRESSDLLKGAAGYVFDIPKICCSKHDCYPKQETSEVPKSFHKRESSDLMKGSAGYVFDIPKICCSKHDCCPKQETSEVLKSFHKQESSDLMKGAAGYVFDIPKIWHKQETSEVPQSFHKRESSGLMKGAAGYVFDIPKICFHMQETSEVPKSFHKRESSNLMKGAAGHVFDTPKICCDKQESPNPMKGAAGYVVDLAKIDKDQRQSCKENKTEKHKKITTNECNMCNGSETSSSSETKTARFGSENGRQVFNKNKFGSKRTISDSMHICCKTKNGSDSQKYKPTKNAQGLFKNILQTQENALKIENTLSGYIYELPKYSPTIQKKSCDFRESDKNKSAPQNILESLGCVTELQTCKTSSHEPANKIGINRHKEKGIASDLKYKLVKKKSCEAPGYVWVVPKHSTKHYDHKKQKCDCKESAKYKSDKPGYGLEQKNKTNSCAFTEAAKHKPKVPECAYDIPNCREIDNAERVWKNKNNSDCKCKKKSESEPSGFANELPKCTHKIPLQKRSCVCRESANSKSASLEDAQELTKCTHKIPSQKSSCVCRQSAKNKSTSAKDVQELAKCTHKPQSQKSSSECPESVSKAGKIQSGSPGYVFVLPQETKKSCDCIESAKNSIKSPHEAANNAEVFTINKLESKCMQPNTQSISCKSMAGTQTNTIKVFERLDIPHPASKETIDLCKNLLKNQADTIEVLKKIYLPQESKVVSPNLTELSEVYKNAATQPRSASLNAEVLVPKPEAESNGCLTCRQSNFSNKQKKISLSEIIKRLKEAYKACSCKICECFSSTKLDKTDASKPHESDKFLRSISSLETNEQPLCSCKPCDCVQCTKNFVEQCHCDPCECGDCKTRSINKGQSILVAPVVTEENAPRIACTCSPCACIECGLVYPLNSSIVNEMSTSTNRHALCRCEICLNDSCDQSGLDACKCQKHKIMSKPVERDTDEFDIRTARIVHNTPMFQRVGRSDTIAMFAAIPGRYPTFNKRLSNTLACSCNECECVFCLCQKDAITAIKSSQLFSSNKAKSKSDFNNRYNNYKLKMPYECHLYQNMQIHDTWCDCDDTCDCINGETSSVPENRRRFGRRRYSDDPYERCSKKETLGRVLHSFKKGDVLTPSTHKLKVQNLILQKQHLEGPSCTITKVTTNTDSSCKLRDVDIFNELTSEFNTSNRKIGSITQANMNDFNTKYIHKCKTFKCDAYMQEINKRRSLHKNIATDNETGSFFSDHSSSCYKRYGSNTLFSPNKSRERISCNSSGYNYPEYFIQFPKGTAETSLKEGVLKLDTEETIELDKYNIIQNSTEKHNIVDKIPYHNMTSNENSCMINECNNFSNNKLIAGPTESNDNNSENAHIPSMRRNCKNNLHVQLNNQNDKHTNFGNNDFKKRERNELQNSVCLKSSRSSLKMNNENREYMNAIHDFNEFHVARNVFYNSAEGNTSKHLFPLHDKRYTSKCPKQTTHSNLGNGAEILNVHDHRRVRNTLIEAKKFSLELIRLLKTYEKANNEFESISDTLKLSHPI